MTCRRKMNNKESLDCCSVLSTWCEQSQYRSARENGEKVEMAKIGFSEWSRALVSLGWWMNVTHVGLLHVRPQTRISASKSINSFFFFFIYLFRNETDAAYFKNSFKCIIAPMYIFLYVIILSPAVYLPKLYWLKDYSRRLLLFSATHRPATVARNCLGT